MDWTVFHALNSLLVGHSTIGDLLADFAVYSVPLFALATAAVWLFDRPGDPPKWKVASLAAFTSAAIALATNQVISHIWARPRPTVAHPTAHLFFVGPSADASFPSDHAAAAFAIACAVFFIGRRAGAAFLVVAAALAVDRVMVGLHYPGDVVAGGVIGLAAAWIIHRFAGNQLLRIVGWISRVTDPIMRPVWAAIDRRRGLTTVR